MGPDGDGGSVRRLGLACRTAGAGLDSARHELDTQVHGLVKAGPGWSGQSAELFASLWEAVSPLIGELAGFCLYAAKVLGPLAVALDTASEVAASASQVSDPRAVALNGPDPGQVGAQARGQAKAAGEAQAARRAAFSALAGRSVPGFPAPLRASGVLAVTPAEARALDVAAQQVDAQALREAPLPPRPWWERVVDGAGDALLGGVESAGDLVGLGSLYNGTPAGESWKQLGEFLLHVGEGANDAGVQMVNGLETLSGVSELPSLGRLQQGGLRQDPAEIESGVQGVEQLYSAWHGLAQLDPARFFYQPKEAAGSWESLLKGLVGWNAPDPGTQLGEGLVNIGSFALGGRIVSSSATAAGAAGTAEGAADASTATGSAAQAAGADWTGGLAAGPAADAARLAPYFARVFDSPSAGAAGLSRDSLAVPEELHGNVDGPVTITRATRDYGDSDLSMLLNWWAGRFKLTGTEQLPDLLDIYDRYNDAIGGGKTWMVRGRDGQPFAALIDVGQGGLPRTEAGWRKLLADPNHFLAAQDIMRPGLPDIGREAADGVKAAASDAANGAAPIKFSGSFPVPEKLRGIVQGPVTIGPATPADAETITRWWEPRWFGSVPRDVAKSTWSDKGALAGDVPEAVTQYYSKLAGHGQAWMLRDGHGKPFAVLTINHSPGPELTAGAGVNEILRGSDILVSPEVLARAGWADNNAAAAGALKAGLFPVGGGAVNGVAPIDFSAELPVPAKLSGAANGKIEIEPAQQTNDVPNEIYWRIKHSEWLIQHGQSQWSAFYPDTNAQVLRYVDAVSNLETWAVRLVHDNDGEVTGTYVSIDDFGTPVVRKQVIRPDNLLFFSISRTGNPILWSRAELSEPAVYGHTFMVNPDLHGGGLFREILPFIKEKAAAAGARYLRIDVNTDNTALQAYYERLGFKRVRIADVPGYPSGALFQLDLRPRVSPWRVRGVGRGFRRPGTGRWRNGG